MQTHAILFAATPCMCDNRPAATDCSELTCSAAVLRQERLSELWLIKYAYIMYTQAAPWTESSCLPSAHAEPTCSVGLLPSPPANAAWNCTNGCNVAGTGVPVDKTCAAACLPGFVQTGGMLVGCAEVENEAGSQYWTALQKNLTCTGVAALAWALLAYRTVSQICV
jgi:hypothetical protein